MNDGTEIDLLALLTAPAPVAPVVWGPLEHWAVEVIRYNVRADRTARWGAVARVDGEPVWKSLGDHTTRTSLLAMLDGHAGHVGASWAIVKTTDRR